MSMSTTFDSLGYAKRLENAGVPREQAEAQADALRDLIEGQPATKSDLKELETNLRHDMREMEQRITIRLGGIAIACSVILLALLPMMIGK